MADVVRVRFEGDASDLTSAFRDAGADAGRMASDIDSATGRSRASLANLEGGVDASEGKFRAFGDTINGTGDVMEGFRTGNLAQVAMGFADLAGATSELILPALKKVGTHFKDVGVAASDAVAKMMTTGSSTTLGSIGLLGAKLAAVLLVAEGLETVLDNILGMDFAHGPFDVLRDMGKNNPLGLPDFVRGGLDGLRDLLPFHTGGMVGGPAGQEVMARLQAGETVIPRGKSMGTGDVHIHVSGSVIAERDLGRMVADALRNNRLIGVTA